MKHPNSPKKEMYIIAASCWKCEQPLNVALISADSTVNGQVYGPEAFSTKEVEIAATHGVLIKDQYSGTRQEIYYANTCLQCGGFVGQHYLFTNYFCAAKYGDYTYKTIDIATV